MDPSQVRTRVLAEHADLRARLDEIEGLADRFEHGDHEAGPALRTLGRALYDRFASHLALEEALLDPVLRQRGRRGEALADRLGREHEEQRELLVYLLGRLEAQSLPTLLVARELRNFATYLRDDMACEERTLLAAGPLASRVTPPPD